MTMPMTTMMGMMTMMTMMTMMPMVFQGWERGLIMHPFTADGHIGNY